MLINIQLSQCTDVYLEFILTSAMLFPFIISAISHDTIYNYITFQLQSQLADADDAWDGFRDADDSRRGGPRSALPTADDSREDVRPKDRAKLSVSQKAPAPKQVAPKSGSRGPRKSSGKGGGPAYGKKNTKKKGNGRGGHR